MLTVVGFRPPRRNEADGRSHRRGNRFGVITGDTDRAAMKPMAEAIGEIRVVFGPMATDRPQ